jgi:5-methyltetrahydrofolate--homocysteine methyltransferase
LAGAIRLHQEHPWQRCDAPQEVAVSTLEELKQAVIDGQVARAREIAEAAVAAGSSPEELFSEALAPAMDEVGKRMQRAEYYIPEVLVSAKAMKAAAEVLKPLIVESGGMKSRGKVLMGTVKGDLHDIGKNLVIMMLEGAGFEVIDLGVDVTVQRFVEAVRETKPQVVGLSAMLTTTMMEMPRLVQALEAEGLRSQVKLMVGGAPVSHGFCEEIGADGYGIDSTSAVELTRAWTSAE